MHNNQKILCIFIVKILKKYIRMEPIKVKKLPIEYNSDKELLRLLAEANEKYGEYKSLIKNIEFDSKYFLDSIILSESLNIFL